MSRITSLRLFLPVWVSLVIAVSISPLSFKLKLHTTGAYHNLGHYVVYLLTGILLWLVVEKWFQRVIVFLLGMVLAFGQEWLENKLFHAGFEWRDVKTDFVGLLTGFALMLLLAALRLI